MFQFTVTSFRAHAIR